MEQRLKQDFTVQLHIYLLFSWIYWTSVTICDVFMSNYVNEPHGVWSGCSAQILSSEYFLNDSKNEICFSVSCLLRMIWSKSSGLLTLTHSQMWINVKNKEIHWRTFHWCVSCSGLVSSVQFECCTELWLCSFTKLSIFWLLLEKAKKSIEFCAAREGFISNEHLTSSQTGSWERWSGPGLKRSQNQKDTEVHLFVVWTTRNPLTLQHTFRLI